MDTWNTAPLDFAHFMERRRKAGYDGCNRPGPGDSLTQHRRGASNLTLDTYLRHTEIAARRAPDGSKRLDLRAKTRKPAVGRHEQRLHGL